MEWDSTKHKHPDWPEDIYLIWEKGEPRYGKQAMIMKEGRDDDLYEELTRGSF